MFFALFKIDFMYRIKHDSIHVQKITHPKSNNAELWTKKPTKRTENIPWWPLLYILFYKTLFIHYSYVLFDVHFI